MPSMSVIDAAMLLRNKGFAKCAELLNTITLNPVVFERDALPVYIDVLKSFAVDDSKKLFIATMNNQLSCFGQYILTDIENVNDVVRNSRITFNSHIEVEGHSYFKTYNDFLVWATATELPTRHYKSGLLQKAIECRLHTYIVGPAGSGKTTAAQLIAQDLGMDFAAMSVGPMTSKSDLIGFRDANGVYHETDLIRLARNGGIMLLDEIDAGNAGVLTIINSILSGSFVSCPDGMFPVNKNFILIAAANTFGTGCDRQYVGRNQIDAATLDRFCFIEWDYDEAFEAALIGSEVFNAVKTADPKIVKKIAIDAGGKLNSVGWIHKVHSIRHTIEQHKLRVVVSPRATFAGVKLLDAGVGITNVIDMLILRGMDATTRQKIGL